MEDGRDTMDYGDGNVVVPRSRFLSNATALHEYLFGDEEEYVPSSKVKEKSAIDRLFERNCISRGMMDITIIPEIPTARMHRLSGRRHDTWSGERRETGASGWKHFGRRPDCVEQIREREPRSGAFREDGDLRGAGHLQKSTGDPPEPAMNSGYIL